MKRILLALLLCTASVRAGDIFIFNSGASTAALQPADLSAFAATGTVWAAQRLGTSTSWTAVEDGTNWLYVVTNVVVRLDEIIVGTTFGEGYDGPVQGTVYRDFAYSSDGWKLVSGDMYVDLAEPYGLLNEAVAYSVYSEAMQFLYILVGSIPGQFVNASGWGFSADWVYSTVQITNRTAQATVTDLTAHNINPASHADIRAAINTNTAAIALLPNVSGFNMTNGTIIADGVFAGSKGVFFVPPGSTNRYWFLLEAL